MIEIGVDRVDDVDIEHMTLFRVVSSPGQRAKREPRVRWYLG